MIELSRTVSTDPPVEQVAAYLWGVTTSADWNPHTTSGERVDSGPLRVGAQFDNTQRVAVQPLSGAESAPPSPTSPGSSTEAQRGWLSLGPGRVINTIADDPAASSGTSSAPRAEG